jgi:hypothetical protein
VARVDCRRQACIGVRSRSVSGLCCHPTTSILRRPTSGPLSAAGRATCRPVYAGCKAVHRAPEMRLSSRGVVGCPSRRVGAACRWRWRGGSRCGVPDTAALVAEQGSRPGLPLAVHGQGACDLPVVLGSREVAAVSTRCAGGVSPGRPAGRLHLPWAALRRGASSRPASSQEDGGPRPAAGLLVVAGWVLMAGG